MATRLGLLDLDFFAREYLNDLDLLKISNRKPERNNRRCYVNGLTFLGEEYGVAITPDQYSSKADPLGCRFRKSHLVPTSWVMKRKFSKFCSKIGRCINNTDFKLKKAQLDIGSGKSRKNQLFLIPELPRESKIKIGPHSEKKLKGKNHCSKIQVKTYRNKWTRIKKPELI
jgi:hypothetical protein